MRAGLRACLSCAAASICLDCRTPPSAAQAPPAVATLSTSTPAPTNDQRLTLSFLGLNDLHGHIRALPAFAGYVNNVRAARARDGGAVALVDAGDMFQGTLESNLTEGASVLAAYRALGMSAGTLGNHEFDFGPEGPLATGDPQGAIRARIREASFPILSANLVERNTGVRPEWQGLRSSVIVNVGGVRVGFVGLLTRETPSIVMGSWFAGLDVADLGPALQREAMTLRKQGAEIVLGIAHAGADCKRFDDPNDLSSCKENQEIFTLANSLPAGTVDGIFAGHTHAGVAHRVNGIPILEAYSRGRAFSRLDLIFDRATHRVLGQKIFPPHELCPDLTNDAQCLLTDYEGAPVAEDPKLTRAIAPALALAEKQRSEPLGTVADDAIPGAGGHESPLGNLFADLLHDAVSGSDAAILNGGTLRSDLPAGPLTYGALFEAMPFDNLTARVVITGAELKRVLQVHLAHDAHGIVSVSGLRVIASCGKSGLEVLLQRPSGKAVTDSESLILVTSDYLATGGDDLFRPAKLDQARISVDAGLTFRDALAAALKRRPHISSKDRKLFDPSQPRLKLPSARPVKCE
jgi:2',3'-cyclic-nucleotide 2'-phosphodiesterase (5'-nucleotidase family)